MKELTDRDIERKRKELLEGKKRAISTRIKEDLFVYLRSMPGDKLTEKLEKVLHFAKEQGFDGSTSNTVKRIEANYQYINELRRLVDDLRRDCDNAFLNDLVLLKEQMKLTTQRLEAAELHYQRDMLLRDGWCKNHLKKYHNGDGSNVS